MPAFPGAKFSGTGKDTRTETGKASFTGGDARAATEKEMRRQVTAIRLRNALDPKRFYRGSGGTGAEKGMPAFAQLGKIVGGGLEPSSVLTRKQRADTVVGELVRDAESVSYSKRKFGEVRKCAIYAHTSAPAKTHGAEPEAIQNAGQTAAASIDTLHTLRITWGHVRQWQGKGLMVLGVVFSFSHPRIGPFRFRD